MLQLTILHINQMRLLVRDSPATIIRLRQLAEQSSILMLNCWSTPYLLVWVQSLLLEAETLDLVEVRTGLKRYYIVCADPWRGIR